MWMDGGTVLDLLARFRFDRHDAILRSSTKMVRIRIGKLSKLSKLVVIPMLSIIIIMY